MSPVTATLSTDRPLKAGGYDARCGERWSDKSAFRSAATCAGAVIAVALAVMALTVVWAATGRRECADRGQSLLCPDPARMVPVFVPTAILLLGGLGAFVVA
ncbi:hypothetical protein R1X32_11715 (plasmid) [Rhodococcus opacus]|uniref:hypothetical protein n=1 Tax=Rhodococcus opacus TaxID=37919 RepID=UPI0034D16138